MTESELRQILGANLKRYRTFRGFSQAKLAELVDISPNFISDIENGKRWLSSDTLVNLATALNIEVHELLKTKEDFPDNFTAFVAKYTAEVSDTINKSVAQSLEHVRGRYHCP
jgi:transcriptional regulator with XRE-family HTH domain